MERIFTFILRRSFLSMPGPRGKAPNMRTTSIPLNASAGEVATVTPTIQKISEQE
jgi:hypothetical protein